MLVVSTPSRWRTGVTYRYSASRLAHGEGLLQAVEQTLRWSMSCAGRAVDIDEGLQNKMNEVESDRAMRSRGSRCVTPGA